MYHCYWANKASSAAGPAWVVRVGSSDCQAENQILGKGIPHNVHKVRFSFLVILIVFPFN